MAPMSESKMRRVHVNLRKQGKKFPNNSISNAKYKWWTFIPKLWPAITAVHPLTTWTPLMLVCTASAIREGIDDYRRRKADKEANNRIYTKIVPTSGESSTASPRTGGWDSYAMGQWADDWTQHTTNIKSGKIRVGDLIVVRCGQEVPCDLAMVRCISDAIPPPTGPGTTQTPFPSTPMSQSGPEDEVNCQCLVETSNLDGETDLKERSGIPQLAGLGLPQLAGLRGIIECSAPNADVYRFDSTWIPVTDEQVATVLETGVTPLPTPGGQDAVAVEGSFPLSADQLLQQGVLLHSPAAVIGVAVYTANQTKLGQNRSPTPDKRAVTDYTTNRLTAIVFVGQLVMVLILGIWGLTTDSYRNGDYWYLGWDKGTADSGGRGADPDPGSEGSLGRQHWWRPLVIPLRFLLLNSMMIPISLKVTLDIVKYFYAMVIGWDLKMYDEATDTPAVAANTNIAEDLGQIDCVLTDKTGTLTENVMKFHRCLVGASDFKCPRVFGEVEDDGTILGGQAAAAAAARRKQHPADAGRGTATRASDRRSRVIGADAGSSTITHGHDQLRPLDIGACMDGGDVSNMPVAGQPPSINQSGRLETSQVTGEGESNHPPGSEGYMLEHFLMVLSVCNTARPVTYATDTEDRSALTTPLQSPRPMGHQPRTASSHAFGNISSRASSSNIQAALAGGDLEERMESAGMVGLEMTDRKRSSNGGLVSLDDSDDGLHIRIATGRRRGSAGLIAALGANPSKVSYDCASPDEEALVEAARDAGMMLISRSKQADGTEVLDVRRRCGPDAWKPGMTSYTVAAQCPFTSDRKRMSVLVETPGVPGYKLLVKGADDVIFPLLDPASNTSQHERTSDALAQYARLGLRTLVMAMREVPEAEGKAWLAEVHQASLTVGDARETVMARAYARIEQKLTLLGATAIEDKLQDGVPETIADLRAAGVQFWMLTGDKLQTAIQIAQSSRMLPLDAQIITHTENTDQSTDGDGDDEDADLTDAPPGSIRAPSTADGGGASHHPRISSTTSMSRTITVTSAPGLPPASYDVTRSKVLVLQGLDVAGVSAELRMAQRVMDDRRHAHLPLYVTEPSHDSLHGNSRQGLLVRSPSDGPDLPPTGPRSSRGGRRKVAEDVERGLLRPGVRHDSIDGGGGGFLDGESSDSDEDNKSTAPGDLYLVVQGPTLRILFEHFKRDFQDLAMASDSVVCCRATPAQKADLVRLVKTWDRAADPITSAMTAHMQRLNSMSWAKEAVPWAARLVDWYVTSIAFTRRMITRFNWALTPQVRRRTLAIGDGGNDCAMILAADVGVGISGREGMQAARAADYAIGRFRFLRNLLMVHGRWSHRRTALVTQYCFFKSMFICFFQVYYNCFHAALSGSSLFDSFSLTAYNTLYTTATVLLFTIDRDRPQRVLLTRPGYYRESRANTWLTVQSFLGWYSWATLQTAITYFTLVWSLPDAVSLEMTADGGETQVLLDDQAILATATFFVVVFIQTIVILLECSQVTIWHVLAAASVVGALFMSFGARDAVVIDADGYGVFRHLMGSPAVWLAMTMAFFAAILAPYICIALYKRVKIPLCHLRKPRRPRGDDAHSRKLRGGSGEGAATSLSIADSVAGATTLPQSGSYTSSVGPASGGGGAIQQRTPKPVGGE